MIVCPDPENCQPYGEHYQHHQGRSTTPSYERCPDLHGSWMCDQGLGHYGPHRAALPGKNRAWRWGLAEVGCADTECMKGADHDGVHNDNKGKSWWPLDAADARSTS